MMSKKIIFGLLFVLGLSLSYAWSRIRVVELGYEVTKLKAEMEKIKRTNGILKSKVAKSLSTNQLVRFSKKYNRRLKNKYIPLIIEINNGTIISICANPILHRFFDFVPILLLS